MPVYDFECPICNKVEEREMKLSETTMPECDKCKVPMTKLMSAPAFHLKGNCWYSDHYGLKQKSKGEGKNGS